MPIDVEDAYRRYGPLVWRRCEQLLHDPQDASDAAHDTFVLLTRRAATLHDQALGGLLFRMATNVSISKLRQRTRRPVHHDEALLRQIASAEDPSIQAIARATLDRIFGREPESTATIAVLHFVDGMTLAEVAREVGMSVSGVRYRLRHLKTQLAEQEEEP